MKRSITIKQNQEEKVIISESGDYHITLAGEGAYAEILGAFHLKGEEKLEVNITTIHAAAHTSADTLIKVIADGSSQATINGTIIVQKNAQQTNSFLTENILMLSDQATALAIPNLEIEADDVKCSHAATVGKIPDEYIFYLQSRGIAKKEAKDLIAEGFLKPVLERIKAIE